MNDVNGHQHRAPLGIGLMLLAYFLFSFINVSAKWIVKLGLVIWVANWLKADTQIH